MDLSEKKKLERTGMCVYAFEKLQKMSATEISIIDGNSVASSNKSLGTEQGNYSLPETSRPELY